MVKRVVWGDEVGRALVETKLYHDDAEKTFPPSSISYKSELRGAINVEETRGNGKEAGTGADEGRIYSSLPWLL